MLKLRSQVKNKYSNHEIVRKEICASFTVVLQTASDCTGYGRSAIKCLVKMEKSLHLYSKIF